MTASHIRTRIRRGVATGVTVAVGLLGTVAVAPTAQAASGTLIYRCTGAADAFDLPVVIDTNAPARMYTGEKADIVVTASSALPADQAKTAYDTQGARSFDGTLVAKVTIGAAALDVSHAIAKTPMPIQATATQVPFAATSAALPFTAPATPGDVAIRAGDLTATLNFYDDADATTAGSPLKLTCTAPPGQPALVDTIAVVSRSSTTLTLSKSASQYGEDVTATAKVTTTAGAAGPADGDVAFAVDGVVTRAKVDRDGIATLVLPDTAVGAHRVTATFVPRDVTHYDGSTTAAQTWDVSKVRTKMRVPVTGKRVGTVTRVAVRAKGAFDTVPTGKVTIKLKRANATKKWIKVRKLDDQGKATAGFGKLKKGRYKVVVTYRGDTNHNAKKKVKRFRVTR